MRPALLRHTELESGHEKIIGRFETESGKANLGHEPQLINAQSSEDACMVAGKKASAPSTTLHLYVIEVGPVNVLHKEGRKATSLIVSSILHTLLLVLLLLIFLLHCQQLFILLIAVTRVNWVWIIIGMLFVSF